jgi:hypothetical protein
VAVLLPQVRSRLRLDLFDPAGASQRWTDADLDRAAVRAVGVFTEYAPRVVATVLSTTAGSRNVSLAGLGAYLEVVRVDYPVARSGYAEVDGAELWRLDPAANVVTTLAAAVPDGSRTMRVTLLKEHTIAEASGTVDDVHLELIALGAGAYAMLAYSTPTADNFRFSDGEVGVNVDETKVSGQWLARAQEAHGRFMARLARVHRAGSVRSRYTVAV